MKTLKFFSFFLTVYCDTRSASSVKCLKKLATGAEFGYLKYDKYELDLCENILQEDTKFEDSSCKEAGTTRSHLRTTEDIQCTSKDVNTCPPSKITACVHNGQKPTVTDKFCTYKCTEETLACPATIPANRSFVNSAAYCFYQDVSQCEFKDLDDDAKSQLEWTCGRRPCGYMSDQTGFTSELTFDGSPKEFKETIVAESAQIGDFGCKGQLISPECTCTSTDLFLTTAILTCPESAYTSKCLDDDKCVYNECFKGKPITDYIYDNCTPTNDDLEYCKRDVKAMFPCGDFEHNCEKTLTGHNCECLGTTVDDCPTAQWETDKCVKRDIPLGDEMNECEMTCFDNEFVEMNCLDASKKYIGDYWQCFDDFSIKIVAGPTTDKYFEVKTIIAEYKDFEKCTTTRCPAGNCLCDDADIFIASTYCKNFTDYYVSKRENEIRDTSSFEFHCLSFMKTHNKINNITNVDDESECYELLPPEDEENAICPNIGGCHLMANSDLSSYGVKDCMCKEECSYECDSSKYDAVFPNDLAKDQVFTTYTCEKNNLVMIICTSIFVPLGVIGIGAGVYFFFFYESSEVAPVETDTDLEKTRNSEQNQKDEKQEETQSEITRDD